MSFESVCAAQDDLIERTNRLLEQGEWYEASGVAYEALRQRRRRLAYSYRSLNLARLWREHGERLPWDILRRDMW